MNQLERDYLTIMTAYQKCIKLAKGKKKTCTRSIESIMSAARQYVGLLSDENLTRDIRVNVVKKGKLLFQQYLEWYKRKATFFKREDYETMNTLMDQIGLYEAEKMQDYRSKVVAGDRIDMEKLFSDLGVCHQLLMTGVDVIVDAALRDAAYPLKTTMDTTLYVAKTGKKYHRVDCPFCSGRQLYPISRKKAENIGVTPCRCIRGDGIQSWFAMVDQDERTKLDQKTVTVFVDESLRQNPFYKIDRTMNECEGVFSYLICRGCLESEEEAIPDRIIKKRAALAENARTINETTLAGIVDALMWIALMYDFHGDVMIYVDNGSMIGKWKKNHRYDRLRSEFSSVEVISISREKNTKADRIGRDTAFVPVNTAFLGEMISRYQKWEKVEGA